MSKPSEGRGREFEVIVWGASGFTGRLTAEHLLRRFASTGDLRWALGGRSRKKLEAVRDEGFVSELAGRTEVVCTTVGPYAKYGSELVAACTRRGTDYCDLTGEVQWMQRMIEAHEDAAKESGARIVHNCGFDCIPSDLGVFFVQREMRARVGRPSPHVQLRVRAFSGGWSGGTIASMLTMFDEAERDPGVLRAVREPYSLNPKDQRTGPDAAEGLAPRWDPAFGEWTAPFVMAGINTKVVRRTNALLDYSWGRDFRYDEAVLTGSGPLGLAKAVATSTGTAAARGAMAVGPIRRFAARRLPQPGEGPSRAQRESGFFDLELRAVHPDDPSRALCGRVHGDRDPGYGSTSKMLAESAVCLARDVLTVRGGFWTPASAMGDALLDRLASFAGVTFRLDED